MKPILFNTEMVEAILNGKKTMTRRVIKFSEGITERLPINGLYGDSAYLFYPRGITYPKYKVGEVLYVRETWCTDDDMADVFEENLIHGFYYRADNTDMDWVNDKEIVKWHPSIHMPKVAARIFLKVTKLRVEKLQEISADEIYKEGVEYITGENDDYSSECDEVASLRVLFQALWDSTIKKSELDRYGWDKNPWVFVYEFERCEKPVEVIKE